jgi:hypothetical protein
LCVVSMLRTQATAVKSGFQMTYIDLLNDC